MATHDVRNWLKLNLLLDRACFVLRQLFQKSWRSRFGHEWSGTDADIKTVLEQRQMQRIGKLQRKTILTGDVNSWDLTTLRAILTSKEFLNLTAKESSQIDCIAKIRNELAHGASKGITDDELNAHWCSVSAILVQFGESEADLELLKQESQVGGVVFIKKEEPINDESTVEARRLKEAGNAQFRSENWAKSITIYTQAILLPGLPSADRATLYSNRSAAFLRQKDLSLALEDAEKTIELWPEWWRGHFRMGQIYTEMNKYKKAEGCFDEAFAREPHREEIKEARSYARLKRGELDRNDAMDARFVHQSLDDAISEFERRTALHFDAEIKKEMLHTNVNDTFLQNWQDCQRGNNHQIGVDGYPRDYVVAAQYFKKAADRGSAEGLRMLSVFTMEGKGVKRDIQLGIKLLKQAAEQPPILINGMVNVGVAEAEHTLGLYFENGIGLTKNEFAAMSWYTKACEHGSVTAANNLGLICMGKGNNVKAEQYLKLASNAGYAKAMVNLAFYYCSQGYSDLALTWCKRARNAGEMSTNIDRIEKFSKDAVHNLKECGIEEWESKNAQTATGMSIKQRIDRFAYQSGPNLADFAKAVDEFAKQVTESKDYIHTFLPDQLTKYAKSSAYARELQKAQNHYFTALFSMMHIDLPNCSPLDLHEKFITELSSCAKIEFMVAQFPMELHLQACSLVDHLLTLESTFHEDTCICYAALNGLSSKESSVTFLSECIRNYPQNVYFIKTRGQLYAFLGRYEDGIRDMNASIKLDPSSYDLLYDRAAMMRLFYPKVSAKEAIAAYNDFLAVAPEDHRKVPESYYGMAQLCMGMTQATAKSNLDMKISTLRQYYNSGVEAEEKQLSFFLPYQSNTKASVEILVKPITQHELRNGRSGVAQKSNPQVAQVADPVEANVRQTQTDEKSTTERRDRVFRSALSDPSRENMTKTHRKHISSLSAQLPSGLMELPFSFKPLKVQKSARSLIGLKEITLNEMDHRQDKIYNGYVLAVTIIDDITFMSSMTTIIEDSSGDVLLCAIYNWPYAEDRVKARNEFGIGCKISIINPYMRMAMDGKSLIRVEDPASIIFHGFVEKMCRYCCEPNASKACAKCMACYCDKECQRLDWKRDHKLICNRNF